MFSKRMLILLVPLVFAGWAVEAQESRQPPVTVAQASAPINIASPAEFKRVMRGMLDGPDKKIEIIVQGKHGTIQKLGDKIILQGDGLPPEEHTLADAEKNLSDLDLIGCQSNLKKLGTAAEMYATDNAGLYPTTLAKLTPKYLKVLEPCPAADADTYSGSYTVSSAPNAYTMFCQGSYHKKSGAAANFPQYNSNEGLLPGASSDAP